MMHSLRAALLAFVMAPLALSLSTLPAKTLAAEDDDSGVLPGVVLSPKIKRTKVPDIALDDEEHEVIAYMGTYQFENFSTEMMTGVRYIYHANPWIFFELSHASASTDDSSREQLGLASVFDEDNFTYTYANVGVKVLRGQIFVRKWRAIPTHLYVSGGFGTASITVSEVSEEGQDDLDLISANLGVGMKALLTDWLNLSVEARAHILEQGDFPLQQGTMKNLETHIGIGIFF